MPRRPRLHSLGKRKGNRIAQTGRHPLQKEGRIEAFLQREVLPYSPDACYQPDSVKIGYEIAFTHYFYKPNPMRTLEEIRVDILAMEKETEGLLAEIVSTTAAARNDD